MPLLVPLHQYRLGPGASSLLYSMVPRTDSAYHIPHANRSVGDPGVSLKYYAYLQSMIPIMVFHPHGVGQSSNTITTTIVSDVATQQDITPTSISQKHPHHLTHPQVRHHNDIGESSLAPNHAFLEFSFHASFIRIYGSLDLVLLD